MPTDSSDKALSFDIGLVAEFSFQKTAYEENSRRVELRPILEKRLGRLQVDLNPVPERALHGPGIRDGWNFEPAFRLAYDALASHGSNACRQPAYLQIADRG